MSLRDQLLKAGLAKPGQARVVEQKKRREARNPKLKDGMNDAVRDAAFKAAEEQRERSKKLNEARQEKLHRKEIKKRIQTVLENEKLNNPHAQRPFRFPIGKRVKTIHVSEEQFKELMASRLAAVVVDERIFLVKAEVVERLKGIDKTIRYHLPSPVEETPKSSPNSEIDDPYAGFEVPDDIVW